MALTSTIFKVELHVANVDRHYYETHNLTIARHPSETDERMMVRVLAFACNAKPALAFAQGLSSPDEPDLWEKDLQGSIKTWIMVGLPDEKQIKKALSRSERVIIYAYGGSSVAAWWQKMGTTKLLNVAVEEVPLPVSKRLSSSVTRTMKVQCTIEDQIVWWSQEGETIEIKCNPLKAK